MRIRELSSGEINILKSYIKVIEAFLEGKELQQLGTHDNYGKWQDCNDNPLFDFQNFNYRIKPETKELYYCVFRGNFGGIVTTNPRSMEGYKSDLEYLKSMQYTILEERKITVTSEYE